MSSEPSPTEYPQISPSNFDLIIVGTGFPESILAAASSSAGKSVLHIDPNPFYGSHFSSLSPSQLHSFLLSLSSSLYSGVDISPISPEISEHSRKFSLDVSGPRVLFCADSAINLLIRSGVSQYLEFKSVDASLIYDDGNLVSVPDSRSAIFKDKRLGLMEKNQLMQFFKLVQGHLEAANGGCAVEGVVGEGKTIEEEDLESPYFEFLTKMKLPPKLKSYRSISFC